jgi:hypothetical protein
MFKNDFYEFLDQNIFLTQNNETFPIHLLLSLYSLSDGHMQHSVEDVYDSTYTKIKTISARTLRIDEPTMLKIINNGIDELKKVKMCNFEYFYLYNVKRVIDTRGNYQYFINAAFE